MTSIDRDSFEYHEAARRLAQRPGGRHPAPQPEDKPIVVPITLPVPVDPLASVAQVGLPHHAPVRDVEAHGRAAADKLHDHPKVFDLARQLAANGYPASTLGDGGSRGTDGTSSTERAAGVTQDKPQVLMWKNADVLLAAAVADYDRASKELALLVANIVQHTNDIDPVPVGTGECLCCGRFCRPDKDKPGNRLRSGLCPTDYRAWLRAGQPARSDWVRTRRDGFTDEKGKLHTPEPDHDIDLSSEAL